jgi:alanyl-tRNA synthetase
VAQLAQSSREGVADKVRDMLERIRGLEKENRTLKDRLALGQGTDLASSAIELNGTKVLATRVDGADAGSLRSAVDQLKSRLRSAVIVLGAVQSPAKVLLVAGVTDDQTEHVKAGELIGAVAAQVGGKGGGRADFAQAGGTKPEALDDALASVVPWVRARLASH